MGVPGSREVGNLGRHVSSRSVGPRCPQGRELPTGGSRRIPFLGSPGDAATFVDEAANGRAAEMAAGLHRATWARRMFSFWKRLSSTQKRRLDE